MKEAKSLQFQFIDPNPFGTVAKEIVKIEAEKLLERAKEKKQEAG